MGKSPQTELPITGGWRDPYRITEIDKSRSYSPEFEQFWEAYPRRQNKYASWISWQAARKEGHKHGLILLRAQQFADSDVGRNLLRYIPLACTWLNQRRFLDDPACWSYGITGEKIGGNGSGKVDWNFKA